MHKIVEDIYSKLDHLNDGSLDISEEDLDTLGDNIKKAIKSWANPEKREGFYLRMSNVGRPARRLWYDKRTESGGERISPEVFIKFLYGHILEEVILTLVRMAGHEVTDEQKEVELEGLKGHIDCKINGRVVDIKTASGFSFKKFSEGTLHQDDPFGYMMQLSSYEEAEGTSNGGFLALNKETGALAMYNPGPLVKPNATVTIQNLKEKLENDTPPERCYDPVAEGKKGNLRLSSGCAYCPHKKECWSDSNNGTGLKAFKYSNGLKYFTRVISQPRVEEVFLH
tara:strand:+ start:2291 stop:3139 length:849 start_codon:yes stop_codon:yes gene_type:complete